MGGGVLSTEAEARFVRGVEYCDRFFRGCAPSQLALASVTTLLETENIPYAVIGGFALNAYGHRRVTTNVDVIVRASDQTSFERFGYVRRTRCTFVDSALDVVIRTLPAGHFPGDDKPKPIAFPDPATAIRGETFALLPMPRWIELKLASGMVAPQRLKDLVDVQELCRSAKLSRDVAMDLHPWVRDKFLELWQLAQTDDPF